MEVGARIKQMRRERKITQVELSRLTGISQSSISDIENLTNNPSTTTLLLIASALGCTVAEILGEETTDTDGLSSAERKLILDYRRLTPAGQEYIQHQMYMALNIYIKRDTVSNSRAVNR